MHKGPKTGACGVLKSHLYSVRSEFECYLKSVFRCRRDCSNLKTKHIVEANVLFKSYILRVKCNFKSKPRQNLHCYTNFISNAYQHIFGGKASIANSCFYLEMFLY